MPPLAYTTNLHPAETVDELCATLDDFAAVARERLGWDRLGLDLRLGSIAIAELAAPEALSRLRATIDRHHLSAHTINAFPLGRFQDAVVKDAAYRPDWRDASRARDTAALIPIVLALSDDALITVSTVPGSYRPWGPQRNDPAAIASALGVWAAQAARAWRDSGRTVVLCPEPEPWCFLETSWDVAWFWTGPLREHGLTACAAALDGDRAAAEAALRRHLGICFDTCHFSLAFEDQAAAVRRLVDAGVGTIKCQFSAAPEVRRPDADATGLAALRALAEPRFLHQTCAASASGSLSKVSDLDQLDACLARLPDANAVRSHFHIPIFRVPTDTGLSTTVADSVAGARACLAAGCTHLAVETYTWSILADQERDALDGTVRELEFLSGVVDGITSG